MIFVLHIYCTYTCYDFFVFPSDNIFVFLSVTFTIFLGGKVNQQMQRVFKQKGATTETFVPFPPLNLFTNSLNYYSLNFVSTLISLYIFRGTWESCFPCCLQNNVIAQNLNRFQCMITQVSKRKPNIFWEEFGISFSFCLQLM